MIKRHGGAWGSKRNKKEEKETPSTVLVITSNCILDDYTLESEMLNDEMTRFSP